MPASRRSPTTTATATSPSRCSSPAAATSLSRPPDAARAWAAELDGAVLESYREATGDPTPCPTGSSPSSPTRRLPARLDPHPPRHRRHTGGHALHPLHITGAHVDDGPLRQAIVETLTERFNTAYVAVSRGYPRPPATNPKRRLQPPGLPSRHADAADERPTPGTVTHLHLPDAAGRPVRPPKRSGSCWLMPSRPPSASP